MKYNAEYQSQVDRRVNVVLRENAAWKQKYRSLIEHLDGNDARIARS